MALILNQEQLDDLLTEYMQQDAFVFDVETIGDDRSNPHIATVAWISLACADRADVIPMGHPNGDLLSEERALVKTGQMKIAAGKSIEDLKEYDFSKSRIDRTYGPPPEQLARGDVFRVLRPLFFDPQIRKIGHNIRFDLHAVAKYFSGEVPVGPYFDTLIASWLVDVSRKGQLDLASCYQRETGRFLKKGIGKDISQHSFYEVAEYSLLDAEATWDVYLSLKEQIESSPRISRLFDLEMLVLNPVLEMEQTGVRIDTDVLAGLDTDLRSDIATIQGEIIRITGNPNFKSRSNKQKQEALFLPRRLGGQGLNPTKPSPSGAKKPEGERTIYDYSVDYSVLQEHAGNLLVDAMLDFNAKSKLHSTYVLPYIGGYAVRDPHEKPKYVDSRLRNGRVYGSFLQFGTESGRFSSREPNLQNIPSRSELGSRVRKAFIADPGHALIVADYSQIEPRIIAALSGDKVMMKTYRDGGDVYQAVADRMSVPRAVGKELVLSIAYGIGPNTISERIGVTVRKARELLNYFNEKFPAINIHKARVVAEARRTSSASTIMGRIRPLPALKWGDPELRSQAERQAYNHRIQGTAADIMKIALVNAHAELPEEAKMLLTVHDEMVVQAPLDMADEVARIVKEQMEAVDLTTVFIPLVADVKIAASWQEGK